MNPNLIERIDNLRAALIEAAERVEAVEMDDGDSNYILARIEDADGIAFEMLTMIDGR